MRRLNKQTIFLVVIAVATVGVSAWLLLKGGGGGRGQGRGGNAKWRSSPVQSKRAMGYLEALCEIGPRPSGSPGMEQQIKLLTAHFEKLGGQVSLQSFETRHPENGSAVTISNFIARWQPERTERVVLCAHYDTRPFPDRDPKNPKGRFVGANDGASGVAVLMEVAHHFATHQPKWGVDIVLFDAEEFIFDERRDPFFLGSEHFAREYAQRKTDYSYRWGVLLDMVGDSQLQIFQENNSVRWADTKPLVDEIWSTARQLGVTEFVARPRYEIRDDHLPLHEIGKIPICDIIDFDYPRPTAAKAYWHTEADTPDKCSGESLAKVGAVVLTWLTQGAP